MGFNKHEEPEKQSRNIKAEIMELLKEVKKNKKVDSKDMYCIYNNLTKLDHHDAVRLDQILTIIANQKESEYQWASICMDKKFKIL